MDKIGVFCSSSNNMAPLYYEQVEALGKWMGQNGKTLVYGGARKGLMETIAKAVKENGGRVFGVVPRKLFQNCMVSDYIDVTFHCDGLSDRKQWLIGESDIMVALPGSIGTLDEAFSAMAENTFGLHGKKVVFWNINGFWDDFFAMIEGLKAKGVMTKPFGEVMLKANSLGELVEILECDDASDSADFHLHSDQQTTEKD